jgi:hypothetical protein
MALTPERHAEIDAELQQMEERLSALASELAKAAAFENDYAFSGKSAEYLAQRIGDLRQSLAAIPQSGQLNKIDHRPDLLDM